MKKICVYVTTIFVVLIQCSINNYGKYYKEYTKIRKFPKTEKWEFKKFSDSSFMLPSITLTIIEDKYLLLGDSYNTEGQMVQIYDLDTGKIIKSFGKKGKGPGEFIYVSYILIDPENKNKFLIHDWNQHRVSLFNIKDIIHHNKVKPDTIIKEDLSAGIPMDFCALYSDTIVATGAFIKGRLCYYNSTFNKIKTAGYIPGNISNTIHLYQYLQTTNIVKNYDRKRIAFGSKSDDILEIYSFNGNIIKTIHGPDINKPAWIEKKLPIDRPRGYFNLCSSSNYIYGVYSGEKPEHTGDWIKTLGKNILIFNWDGDPIKRIVLDVRLGNIVISENRNTIYAVYFDGEYFKLGYYEL